MALCSICLEEMAPGTTVGTLPCGHVFHRGCVMAGQLSVHFNSSRTRLLEVLTPILTRCPNCRRPWEVKDVVLSNVELSWDERAALPDGALCWERFRDPETWRIYWVNPSATEVFWEDGGAWTQYIFEGRKWWCKDAAPEEWFFADTGSQS